MYDRTWKGRIVIGAVIMTLVGLLCLTSGCNTLNGVGRDLQEWTDPFLGE